MSKKYCNDRGRYLTEDPEKLVDYSYEAVQRHNLFPNESSKHAQAATFILESRIRFTNKQIASLLPTQELKDIYERDNFSSKLMSAFKYLNNEAKKADSSYVDKERIFKAPKRGSAFSHVPSTIAAAFTVPTAPTSNNNTAPAIVPPPTTQAAASAVAPPPTPGAPTAAVVPSTPAAAPSTPEWKTAMNSVAKGLDTITKMAVEERKQREEERKERKLREEADEKRWKEADERDAKREAQREKDRQLALERDAKIHAQREEDRKLALERDAKAAKERNKLSKATSTALSMAKAGIEMIGETNDKVKKLEDRVSKLEEKDEEEENGDNNAKRQLVFSREDGEDAEDVPFDSDEDDSMCEPYSPQNSEKNKVNMLPKNAEDEPKASASATVTRRYGTELVDGVLIDWDHPDRWINNFCAEELVAVCGTRFKYDDVSQYCKKLTSGLPNNFQKVAVLFQHVVDTDTYEKLVNEYITTPCLKKFRCGSEDRFEEEIKKGIDIAKRKGGM